MATASHLSVPFAADLSAGGVLSWTSSPRTGNVQGIRPHRAHHGSPGPKVDAALWRRFAALSFGSDEDIRKFAAKWGPLRGKQTETTGNGRFANLAVSNQMFTP